MARERDTQQRLLTALFTFLHPSEEDSAPGRGLYKSGRVVQLLPARVCVYAQAGTHRR